MEIYDVIKSIILNSDNIVFFGGAGVSTASGIPDFRSATGLYNKDAGTDYSPEYMLSRTFFLKHPDSFSEYYKKNLIFPDAKPNAAHLALAELERRGQLKAIITQNIDGLHQMAGSKKVIEIHGNLRDYYCVDCGKKFDQAYTQKEAGLSLCNSCGGIVRPDVVLYEEPLDMYRYDEAVRAVSNADVLLVGGTSLVVYPAAGILRHYSGDKLILINKESTKRDKVADYLYHGDISEILGRMVLDE